MSSSQNFQKLEELYDCLPDIKCQGKCTESCTIVPRSDLEQDYIKEQTGVELQFVELDKELEGDEIQPCSALGIFGNCSIHKARPLICRMFGLTKKMQCPFGCVPSEWVSEEKEQEIFNQYFSFNDGKKVRA